MRTIALFAALFVAFSATGHGGGLDRNGCHTNRKTGDYHCHGGSVPSSVPQMRAPQVQRASATAVTAPATTPKRDLVRAAQTLLLALGYKPTLMGELDERTRSAVRAFQRTEGLSQNGMVTEHLVLRLAEKTTASCR